MNFRKILLTFAFFILSSLTCLYARTVRIGYYETPAFSEGASPDASKYGYAYEYMEIVAKKAGWQIEYVYGNWTELYDKLIKGEIDLMPGVSRTEERLSLMRFPDYEMGQESYYIYKRTGNSSIVFTDIYSLNTKKIGVVSDTIMAVLLKGWLEQRHIRGEIVFFPSEPDIKKALTEGSVDAMCATDNSVMAEQGFAPLFLVGSSNYYLAVSGESLEVLRELNQTLALLKKDFPAFTERLQGKYFANTALNTAMTNYGKSNKEKMRQALDDNSTTVMYVSFTIILMLLLFIGAYVLLMIKIRNDERVHREEMEEHMEILEAMADIYFTSHLINLKTNTAVPIKSNEIVDNLSDYNDAAKSIQAVMTNLTTEAYVNHVLNFMDLKTIPERMRNKKSISTEIIGKLDGWCRVSFITVKTDRERRPTDVMFNVEIIEEEKKNEENLKRLSTTDSLTGLENRTSFDQYVKKTFKKSDEPDYSLTVFAMDLDGLKAANDSKGHDAGDELLVAAASIISQVFGEKGRCFRIGGDEFSVLISAEKPELDDLCTKLDAKIAAWKGDRNPNLHISYGYACLYENPEVDFKTLFKMADMRMYEMKRQFYATSSMDRREHF